MMMGATALDLYKSWGFLTTGDIPMFAVGFITAFVVALIAIKLLLNLIKRIFVLSPFAILSLYCGGCGVRRVLFD